MTKRSTKEVAFRASSGTWEVNPATGLEITSTLTKGVWLVIDACAPADNKKHLFKGTFDNAFDFYNNNQSPHRENLIMQMASQEAAEQFKKDNLPRLIKLQQEAEAIPGVAYSELWLNGSAPSFIAGYNSEDEQIVSLKI